MLWATAKLTRVQLLFEETYLFRVSKNWDVVEKWATVDRDELFPRAVKAWTNDVTKLLNTDHTWTLTNRPKYSAHVKALQTAMGYIPPSGEVDKDLVNQLREAMAAAVHNTDVLLNLPADHKGAMARIKNDIVLGRHQMYAR